MWVINRKTLQVIEVPDDYRECSICLAWKPESDFRNEGEDHVSRTNCRDCFMLPMEAFLSNRDSAEEYRESLRKNGRLRMTMRTLETELRIRRNGVSKDRVREWFDKILAAIPDDAIVDINGGNLEVEQAIAGKPLFQLSFSDYTNDGNYWG